MYLDLVMLFNFIVDLFLLHGTNCLTGSSSNIKRVITAAALGAIYSGACILPGFRFLAGHCWRIVFLALISAIAYGWNNQLLQKGSLFIILCTALGGMTLAAGKGNATIIFISVILLTMLSRTAFGLFTERTNYFPVEISNGNRQVQIVALRDTGNHLRDPISGEQVLIIGENEANELTGLTKKELMNPIHTISSQSMPGLRIIPYKTIGVDNGMLLAMRFHNVKMNGRLRSTIVAFAPNGLGDKTYQGILGGSMQ